MYFPCRDEVMSKEALAQCSYSTWGAIARPLGRMESRMGSRMRRLPLEVEWESKLWCPPRSNTQLSCVLSVTVVMRCHKHNLHRGSCARWVQPFAWCVEAAFETSLVRARLFSTICGLFLCAGSPCWARAKH